MLYNASLGIFRHTFWIISWTRPTKCCKGCINSFTQQHPPFWIYNYETILSAKLRGRPSVGFCPSVKHRASSGSEITREREHRCCMFALIRHELSGKLLCKPVHHDGFPLFWWSQNKLCVSKSELMTPSPRRIHTAVIYSMSRSVRFLQGVDRLKMKIK